MCRGIETKRDRNEVKLPARKNVTVKWKIAITGVLCVGVLAAWLGAERKSVEAGNAGKMGGHRPRYA